MRRLPNTYYLGWTLSWTIHPAPPDALAASSSFSLLLLPSNHVSERLFCETFCSLQAIYDPSSLMKPKHVCTALASPHCSFLLGFYAHLVAVAHVPAEQPSRLLSLSGATTPSDLACAGLWLQSLSPSTSWIIFKLESSIPSRGKPVCPHKQTEFLLL